MKSTFSYVVILCASAVVGNTRCTVPHSTLGPVRADAVEPALRRLSAERPDTVVGMLLRLAREPTSQDSAELTARGFTLHSARGTIVTGRARARASLELSRLTQVVWIELSLLIPTTPREPTAHARQARRQ